MGLIRKELLFNYETLNIFTDGSIKTLQSGETVGCAGSIVVYNDTIIDEKYEIIRQATNNITEISAIRIGICQAIDSKSFIFPLSEIKHINLFSDSQLCIYSLREWIFNWIKTARDTVLYNTSGMPVANQSIILETIYKILNNEVKINLYHVRGHKSKTAKGINEFRNSFRKVNFVKNDVDDELIKTLIHYNDYIDVTTGEELMFMKVSQHPVLQHPLTYAYGEFDVGRYKELIYR